MNKIICLIFCLLLVGCNNNEFRIVKYQIFYIKETGERVKYWPISQNTDSELKLLKIEYFNGDYVRDKWIKQDDLITEEEYNKSHPAKPEKEEK